MLKVLLFPAVILAVLFAPAVIVALNVGAITGLILYPLYRGIKGVLMHDHSVKNQVA